MKKKKVEDQVVSQAEQQEEQRRKAIADYNISNMGKFWIDPNKIPTDEDIANAKEYFETHAKALQEKKDYLIADKPNALRVAKFMKEFIEKSVWTQRQFVGVLNFSAMMNDFIETFDENNPQDLILEYGATQFAFIMFENYGGCGIDSAKHMAEIWEEYVPIYEKLHEWMDWYKSEATKVEELQHRWGMLSQGFYMEIIHDPEGSEIGVENEECESSQEQ